MKKIHSGIFVMTLVGLLAVDTSSATVLFSDGYENATVNGNINAVTPTTGTYTLNTVQPNSMIVVSGSSTGGPSMAYSGSNYLSVTRNDSLGYYPTFGAMFDGGSIDPATQSFSASFAIFSKDGFASFSLGNGFAFNATSQLLANAVQASSKEYRAYNGSAWGKIADIGTPAQWNTIEINWDAINAVADVSINGGTAFTTPLFGAVPLTVDRLVFSNGGNPTQYWIDDVQVVSVIPEPSVVALLSVFMIGLFLKGRGRRLRV